MISGPAGAGGQAGAGVVLALMAWGNGHLVREPKLMHHTCGADLRAVTICADCGEEVRAAEVTAPWRNPAH